MFEVKDCIGFLSNHGAKVIGESMNKYFQKENITRVQWMALYYINKTPGMSQKTLAQDLMIKDPSALHLLDRLEKENLIHRVIKEDNRRINCLYLTEKGEHVYHCLLPKVVEFNEIAIQNISDEHMQVFKQVLDQMINNVT